jgi:phenylpropionate dioxygenase-like ring-hydroxylating dioxygenase large terminal subunit/AcrR family transcriptional regulator
MALEIAAETQAAAPSRRRELIEAAIAAIAEHGLSNLTLAKVAAGAGLTAAAVSFHFKSKEALLQATLKQLSDDFDAALRAAVAAAGDDPAAGLRAVIEVMLDPRVASPARVAVWYAFLSESRARADYQQVCGDKDERYYRIVGELCAALFAGRGGDLDVEALAEGLAGLLDAVWQDILFRGDAFDRGEARRRCLAYLASICPARFDMPRVRRAPAPLPEAGPATTLPAWTYEHPEFFELEREHIFLPSWQLVCHVNDIPEPGDYESFELLGERAFVIRGRDRRLHAFHNVCRHRAHAVVTGERGRCKRLITCPYHGWAYELDGRLRGVPGGPEAFAGLERSEYGLHRVGLEVFMGFVFVRFRGGGPGVAERLAPWVEELAHYRLDEMVAQGARWEERQAVDWKNVMDNYLEDYHFKTGHPGLSELMETRYDREVAPGGASRLSHRMKSALQRSWSVRHYQKLLPVVEHLPEPMRRRWTYVTLFPGVSLDLFPDQMDFLQVLPLGPGQCLLRSRNYALPDGRREMRAARYLSNRINCQVQDQDNVLTASVQGGLRSSAYDVGLLSRYEVVVAGFQRWIREQLPVAGLRTPPPAGSLARRNRELAG